MPEPRLALDLRKLSVSEIRARLLADADSLSPQLLASLKRDPRHGVRALHDVARKRYERARDERQRLDAMLNFERVLWKSGVQYVAGVDEVGMGPLAGPVVAAAVVFAPQTSIAGVDDSKRLDPETRAALAEAIQAQALGIGIGVAATDEIDRINVYQAGLLAMRRAVQALPFVPQHVLVDARTIPELSMPQNPFTKGDGINFSIAAASIVAKTRRDRMMQAWDAEFPEYGFARHKGYSTPEHQSAIRKYGPCKLHRMSYPFIRELRGQYCPLFYELQAQLGRARTPRQLQAFEERLRAKQEALSEHEAKKLKLVLSRRWKTA